MLGKLDIFSHHVNIYPRPIYSLGRKAARIPALCFVWIPSGKFEFRPQKPNLQLRRNEGGNQFSGEFDRHFRAVFGTISRNFSAGFRWREAERERERLYSEYALNNSIPVLRWRKVRVMYVVIVPCILSPLCTEREARRYLRILQLQSACKTVSVRRRPHMLPNFDNRSRRSVDRPL